MEENGRFRPCDIQIHSTQQATILLSWSRSRNLLTGRLQRQAEKKIIIAQKEKDTSFIQSVGENNASIKTILLITVETTGSSASSAASRTSESQAQRWRSSAEASSSAE